MSMDFTIRLRGEPARLLQEMLDKGFVESKTEAVRQALIYYASDIGLMSSKPLLEKSLKTYKSLGKNYTENEVGRQIESVR